MLATIQNTIRVHLRYLRHLWLFPISVHRWLTWGLHPREHRQLPRVGRVAVADDIHIAIVPFDFEIAMVRRQPAVEHFYDLDAPLTDDERARRFVAAVPCVALDTNHRPPFILSATKRMAAKPQTIDNYLARVPDDNRAALENLRKTWFMFAPSSAYTAAHVRF
jgi:hypothetical protein